MRSILTLTLVLLLSVCTGLMAQNSIVINVQGTLKDANGVAVPDGQREVTFKLYNQMSGGTALWTESANVNISGGIYSHNLGSVEPLVGGDFANTVYLGINVGSLELSPRTQLTYAPYALSVASAQQVARKGCSGQVGDIKYSILSPDDFAKENGDCWTMMGGQSIASTRLATDYGITTAPDMSGLFIRATEFQGGADNDPDRAPLASSSLQTDDNKEHKHTLTEDGGHAHTYKDSWLSKIELRGDESRAFDEPMERTTSDNSLPTDVAVDKRELSGRIRAYYESTTDGEGDSYRFINKEDDLTTSSEPDHTHTMGNQGNESRPKNRNFYVYIRVD